MDSLVTKHVTWPPKVMYAADGKTAVYNEISMPLFIQGYLIVMEEEKESVRTHMSKHLKDLMLDSQLYGWENAWAFHVVWLNQLEQGKVRTRK